MFTEACFHISVKSFGRTLSCIWSLEFLILPRFYTINVPKCSLNQLFIFIFCSILFYLSSRSFIPIFTKRNKMCADSSRHKDLLVLSWVTIYQLVSAGKASYISNFFRYFLLSIQEIWLRRLGVKNNKNAIAHFWLRNVVTWNTKPHILDYDCYKRKS